MNKKTVNNDLACGCSIDDLLKPAKDPDENRLCKSSQNDFEVYIDPESDKTSLDFYLRRLTDGLPIIPPTREKVQKFLDYTDRNPDDLIAVLSPRQGKATAEKIAVNAVMAGCLPHFMPMVLHSIKALSNEKFNLTGVNATTHPVSICTILNGPIANEIGGFSGVGCLGPGNIANATIGRAVRLCLMNIAGAIPGVGDFATMGSPAKYSFCFKEAESENPWEPLHIERGFKTDTSTVTVMGVEAPQNVNDHRSKHADDLLDTVTDTISTAGCNNSHVPGEVLIIISPEHADMISKEGWTKQDIKNYIHKNSIVSAEIGDRGGRKLDKNLIFDGKVRITRSPEDVVIVVAGGAGRHTMIAHGFGTSSNSVTQPIIFKDGESVLSVQDYKRKVMK